MAFNVTAVSIRVSPLATDEVLGFMLTTSAPRRLPASSNELWVRVLFSKNRFISVRPLRMSRVLDVCRFRATKASAKSRSSTA